MLSQYKSPLERCIVFNSKTTGLVYRNNMIVTSKCLELRVNSDIVVELNGYIRTLVLDLYKNTGTQRYSFFPFYIY